MQPFPLTMQPPYRCPSQPSPHQTCRHTAVLVHRKRRAARSTGRGAKASTEAMTTPSDANGAMVMMKRTSITIPDELEKALEDYRRDLEVPSALAAVVQAALR